MGSMEKQGYRLGGGTTPQHKGARGRAQQQLDLHRTGELEVAQKVCIYKIKNKEESQKEKNNKEQ